MTSKRTKLLKHSNIFSNPTCFAARKPAPVTDNKITPFGLKLERLEFIMIRVDPVSTLWVDDFHPSAHQRRSELTEWKLSNSKSVGENWSKLCQRPRYSSVARVHPLGLRCE